MKLYIYAAVLLLFLAGGVTITALQLKVNRQTAQISQLKDTEKKLRAAQAVLEETHAKREVVIRKTEAIKREIQSVEDAPLPAPIERALDGLRSLQDRNP